MKAIFSIPISGASLTLPDLSDYQDDGITLKDGCGYSLAEEWQPNMDKIKVLVNTSPDIIQAMKDDPAIPAVEWIEDIADPEPQPASAETVAAVADVLAQFQDAANYDDVLTATQATLHTEISVRPIGIIKEPPIKIEPGPIDINPNPIEKLG